METWEQILVDTESLMESERRIDFLEETDQLRRAEEATSSLTSRLMGACGDEISVEMRNGCSVQIIVKDCSSKCLHGVVDTCDIIIPLFAIVQVKGLSAGKNGDFSGPVSRNMSFASAVRVFADKHREAVVYMRDRNVVGKIVRVGSDFLDIVCGQEIVLIAFSAIDYISEKRY